MTKQSADHELNLMIAKSREEIYQNAVSENHELKDCLKMLQKEMFDIVKLKTEVYVRRLKAEDGRGEQGLSTEEVLKHEIEKIRENLFNMPFQETSRDII